MRYPHVSILLVGLTLPCFGWATDYFVAVNGSDLSGHGSMTKPWASLAYACENVPEGKHAIHVGPGEYVATRTAYPPNGVSIVGRKPSGNDVSRIIASREWPLPKLADHEHDGQDQYLIAATAKRPGGGWRTVKDLTITSLELCSPPDHRITGAIFIRDGANIKLTHLNVHDFRWNGLRVTFCKQQVEIAHCTLTDASTERLPHREGGLIRTRWLGDARIHHNRIIARKTGGYGYKGGGHVKVRFDHNYVDTRYFAFESPFENEFEVELDHNHLTACISIPKFLQTDPKTKGYEYSYRIHHNYLTDSYTIEGPRGYLEFDHNWVHVEKPGGRIYSHHGAKSTGPIRIHHNVIENVDRSLIWMNEGLVEKMAVFNNTITCADAGSRGWNILSAWSGERMGHWEFRNNVVVAAWSQPRGVHHQERGVPDKMLVRDNLFVNFRDVPAGNHVDQDPGLQRGGTKPAPFYLPTGADSFVVDRGVDVGLPFAGKAPDLGAFEYGAKPWTLEAIPKP